MLTGTAAANYAGPRLFSRSFSPRSPAFSRDFATPNSPAMIPVAGSAYTYGYATLGEIDRMDHRLGLDPRICLRRGDRGSGLERVRHQLSQDFGIHISTRAGGYAGHVNLWYIRQSGHWERLGAQFSQSAWRGRTLTRHRCSTQAWHVQSCSRFLGILFVTVDPRHRHQGIGELQLGHRNRQSCRAAGFHRAWRAITFSAITPMRHRQLASRSFRRTPAVTASLAGLGIATRGGSDLLRIHRLRRGLHRGAGSQESEARHAHRHSGFAGHLHDSLHPRRRQFSPAW